MYVNDDPWYIQFRQLVKLNLEQHNDKYNIIKPNQGGFKKKEGTIEHLFVIQNLFQYNPNYTVHSLI